MGTSCDGTSRSRQSWVSSTVRDLDLSCLPLPLFLACGTGGLKMVSTSQDILSEFWALLPKRLMLTSP